MDTDVENIENIPGFYQENYDKANDGNHQRHFIQFNNEGSNENFLLVYQKEQLKVVKSLKYLVTMEQSQM